MTNRKVLLLLAFALFVLIFSALTALFWTFMSDTILVPIYYFLWVCGLLVNSVPQGVYLTLLVIVSMILGAKTLGGARTGQQHRRVIPSQTNTGTRYLHWHLLCLHAHRNWFSKGQLALEARHLILSILAFERGVDLTEAEAMVRNGVLDLPDMLRNVVEAKRIPDEPPNRIASVLLWLRHPVRRADASSDPQVEQFLAELIRFAEHHLEIDTHARNES
jgi:hypothetical protein